MGYAFSNKALLRQLHRHIMRGIDAAQEIGGLQLNLNVRDRSSSAEGIVSLNRIPVFIKRESEFHIRIRQSHCDHAARVVAPIAAAGFFTDECREMKVVDDRADIARAGKGSTLGQDNHLSDERMLGRLLKIQPIVHCRRER
jgi:hypothetical protein